VLLVVACVALYWRVLQPGTIPYGHDTLTHDFPIHLWAWGEVATSGRLPLWIPPLQNGLPTLGSFAWCPLFPTDWLMGLSVAGGFRLQWVLALIVAGFGMLMWGRAAGLDLAGRWTAALAFALCGHAVTLISPGHLQKLQAIAWLPWAVAAVEWGLAARRRPRGIEDSGEERSTEEIVLPGGERCAVRAFLGGLGAGAAIGLQVLASHSQIAYLTVWLVGWRALWLAGVTLRDRRKPQAERIVSGRASAPAAGDTGSSSLGRNSHPPSSFALRSSIFKRQLAAVGALALWAVGIPLGAGIVGGAELLPGIETARLSNRAGGVTYDEAVITSYPPLETLEYLFPRFLGDSVREGWNSYLGEWGERLVTDYAGTGTILLALIGLALGGGRRGLRVWLALTVVLTLLLSFGRYLPLYRIAYDFVPGFNRFRSPGTQMVVAAWGLAALAGLGMTALRATFLSRGEEIQRWVLGLGAVAVLFPWVGLGLFRLADGEFREAINLAAGDTAKIQQHKAILFSSVAWTCVWGGAFAGALLAALVLEAGRRRRDGSVAASAWHPARWGLIVPVAVLSLDLIVRLQPFLSPEDMRPYMAYLMRSPGDVVVARDPHLPRRLIERGNELTIRPILHDIDIPLGYHPVTYRWMLDTMETLGLESPELRSVWAVNYVRVTGTDPPDDATSWTMVLEGPGWILWHDDHVPPFARFPDGLVTGAKREDLKTIFERDGLGTTRPALVSPEAAWAVQRWQDEQEKGDRNDWRKSLPAPVKLHAENTPTTGTVSGIVTSESEDEAGSVSPSGLVAAKSTDEAGSESNLGGTPKPPGAAWAVVLQQGAGEWILRVGSDAPRWLVLSAPPAPGWRAYAGEENPRPLPLWRADGSSTLVPWPGGEDFLFLAYDPWSARFGIFLTLLGAAGFATAAGWAIGRRRRGSRGKR